MEERRADQWFEWPLLGGGCVVEGLATIFDFKEEGSGLH